MAKGKQAALAANRRYEAAVEHIDRLTTELTEAKLRARQHEGATREVAHLRIEVDRLRGQIADDTSDRLADVESRLAEVTSERDELASFVASLRRKWEKALDYLMTTMPGAAATDRMGALAELFADVDPAGTRVRSSDVHPSASDDIAIKIMRAKAARHRADFTTADCVGVEAAS